MILWRRRKTQFPVERFYGLKKKTFETPPPSGPHKGKSRGQLILILLFPASVKNYTHLKHHPSILTHPPTHPSIHPLHIIPPHLLTTSCKLTFTLFLSRTNRLKYVQSLECQTSIQRNQPPPASHTHLTNLCFPSFRHHAYSKGKPKGYLRNSLQG
jgi:hypothetical protein